MGGGEGEVFDDENGDATEDYRMRMIARRIPGSLIRRKEVASCQRRQRPSQSYAESKLRMERIIGQGVQVRFGLTCPFLRLACESIPNHDATTCHRKILGLNVYQPWFRKSKLSLQTVDFLLTVMTSKDYNDRPQRRQASKIIA